MLVARRQRQDPEAEADVRRALTGRREEDVGGAGVRVLLEEVVLDLPDVVEADAVGQLDLVERIGDQLSLGVLGPRARELVLVEDAEAHRAAIVREAAPTRGRARGAWPWRPRPARRSPRARGRRRRAAARPGGPAARRPAPARPDCRR